MIISIFLAINMGARGFSVSFAPSYGAGILKRKWALLFYAVFSLIGVVVVGNRVVETLILKLVGGFDNQLSGILILSSATIKMFLANILRIPQSTSFVMGESFTGSGLFYRNVNFFKLGEIFFVAMIFSFLAFSLAFL